MSGWRHVERRDVDGSCRVTVGFDQYTDTCSCLTPTPDPASPCGFPACPWPDCSEQQARYWHHVAGGPEEPTSLYHPHQPTRCTCGHPVERSE